MSVASPGREYPVAEDDWIQPFRVRAEAVVRRFAPMIAIGLAVWLLWWRTARRKR
jgi:hypothetical protein